MKNLFIKMKKILTTQTLPVILANVLTRNYRLGGIAQLGERLTGSQEVSGSIPLISTNERLETVRFQAFYFFAFIVRFSFVRNLFGMTSVIERKPSIHNECRAFLHFIR